MVNWNSFRGFYNNLTVTNKLETVPYTPNSISNWLEIGDTEKRYKQNLKNRYDDLIKDNWIEKQIEYKFNSNGFRGKDFESDNNAMFLGCSTTLGNGLSIEDTYSELISTELNLNCCNLGIDGASNDTVFRLFYVYFKKLNPKIVVVLSPFMERLEYITSNGPVILRPTQLGKTTDKIDSRFKSFYTSIITEDDNFILNRDKNINSIESYCLKNKTKLVVIYRENVDHIDNARDLIHPGKESHKILYKKVLQLL
jgi:hypothetical protein